MFSGIMDTRISPVGLGTYGLGGRQSASDIWDEQHTDAIKYAISKGINVIDTAEMYGAGHTEELVGKAISSFRRDDIYIISKVWPSNLARKRLFLSAESSLKRLGTDYIDLYLIHWPSQSVPLDETIGAMLDLKNTGSVREIGVSNFSIDLLDQAIDYAGKGHIAANEIELNLDNLKNNIEMIDYCRKNGVKIIAYSPLSRGNISHDSRIREYAKKYGATEAQIILRYLMEFSLPIPKSANRLHIDEIVGSAKIKLSAEDIHNLSK